MQLNIKNEKTYRLAKQLAQLTGENITEALTKAIQARIDSVHKEALSSRKGLSNRLLKIGEQFSSLPELDPREPDEILYDELGLPKDGHS